MASGSLAVGDSSASTASTSTPVIGAATPKVVDMEENRAEEVKAVAKAVDAIPAPLEGVCPYVAEAFQPKDCYVKGATAPPTDATSSSADEAEELPTDEGMQGTNMHDEGHVPPPLEVLEKPWFLLTHIETIPPEADIATRDVDLLHKAQHNDPFAVLGPTFFELPGEGLPAIVVRFWRKDAGSVKIRPIASHYYAFDDSKWCPTVKRCEWLYQSAFTVSLTEEGIKKFDEREDKTIDAKEFLRRAPFFYDAKVSYHNDPTCQEFDIRDAYNFGLLTPQFDLEHFQNGSCWHVDVLMGSHVMTINGVRGVRFTVWAPHAKFVSAVGDWNQWDGRAHPMRKRHEFGVWEVFVPNIGAGEKYGYRIHSADGKDFIKIDPYAQSFENPPATASIVSTCDDAYRDPSEKFAWTDEDWLRSRVLQAKEKKLQRKPMSIYEVHLPSWMRGDGNTYLGYRELADRLVKHLKKLNFTHVEFLPLAHHPFEGSWGYQVSGQYAPYSRLGTGDDLKYLINELHRNNIGVFLDFVPAHFVKDSWGLVFYDGQPCYEYADPREGEHKGWGTMMFNFRQNEVRSFLLGAAYHWLRRYHIDGLRIDAVSSMIYKNHCREPGDWIPNEYGGDANLQAITLLQELNWVVHREFPGVFTMAEESTSWKGVTDKQTGLGFDAKWDLGWMNDTLSYLCTPAEQRWQKHSKLTFRGLYMAHENWVLPLSHDEVVSGKGSLLDKCGFSGTPFIERLRTLRALYGFQIGMPGRPLIFMGGEFGQGREWKEARSVDWHEADEPQRAKTMNFLADLLDLYRTEKALHAGDDEVWNFQWVDCDNAKDSIIAWMRKYGEWTNDILVVVNFAGQTYKHYPIGVHHGGEWTVLLNGDDWKYGGGMVGPGAGVKVKPTQGGRLGWPYCLWLDLAANSCLFLKAPKPEPPTKGLAKDKSSPVPKEAKEDAIEATEEFRKQ